MDYNNLFVTTPFGELFTDTRYIQCTKVTPIKYFLIRDKNLTIDQKLKLFTQKMFLQ